MALMALYILFVIILYVYDIHIHEINYIKLEIIFIPQKAYFFYGNMYSAFDSLTVINPRYFCMPNRNKLKLPVFSVSRSQPSHFSPPSLCAFPRLVPGDAAAGLRLRLVPQ